MLEELPLYCMPGFLSRSVWLGHISHSYVQRPTAAWHSVVSIVDLSKALDASCCFRVRGMGRSYYCTRGLLVSASGGGWTGRDEM